MAKTPVTLKVSGFEDREVASVDFSFEQACDKENQPAGIPRGGKITLQVKALNSGKPDLMQWMLEKSLKKDGEIIFMVSGDTDKKMKSIEFKDAYCVAFTEHWEDTQEDTGLAHFEEITISCKKISNGPVTFENDWK